MEPLRDFLRAHGLAGARPSSAPCRSATATPTSPSGCPPMSSCGARRAGPLPPSAHDVLREARLLSALEPTAVRTPRVLAVCDGTEVIGAPFYVMERVRGEVITDSIPAPLDTPRTVPRIADELIDGLVELHATDWTTLGLEGFGKPTGYLERQLRRFNGLWEHNRTREISELDQVGRVAGRQHPRVAAGHDRARRLPARQHDVRRRDPAAHGGDPGLGDGDDRRPAGRHRLHDGPLGAGRRPQSRFAMHTVTDQPGFPTRAEMVARYEERSGRSVSSLDWYVTLAMWKAVGVHGGQLQAGGDRARPTTPGSRRSARASWSWPSARWTSRGTVSAVTRWLAATTGPASSTGAG